MTAALDDEGTPVRNARTYPERVTFRVNEAVHPLYDHLEHAANTDGITNTHRIWAMLDLFWANGSPEQRQAIQDRARDLGQQIRSNANEGRSHSCTEAYYRARNQQKDTDM